MRILMMMGLCASLMGCIIVPVPVTVSSGSYRPSEAPLAATAPAIAAFDRQFAALRAQNGLPPLRSNAGLDASAMAHSVDMRAYNYVSHEDRSGLRAQGRVHRAGVTRCGIGENIAQGQKSVEEAIAAWMNSPGHRRNMLNRNYASYGIGRAGDYWTLVFALPC
ncbi:MAG: CAP domain-containing protein [Yoonia sp.]|uniref:CAP domain-containing protein n=1 Tax=Yoonia sp. TaxID=2212373 RepID=UPI003265DCA4